MSGWLSGLRAKAEGAAPTAPATPSTPAAQSAPATPTTAGHTGRHWLIGASHIGALRRAQQDGKGGADMTIAALGASRASKAPFHAVGDGVLRFTDAGYQTVFETTGIAAGMTPGDTVGLLLGDANTILLDYAGYWTTHEPAALCQSDRAPMPQTTLEAICDAQTAPVRTFVADLLALGYRPYWVPYPPVKEDHPMFAAGVRPAVVRYLDQVFVTRMRDAMTDLGVPCADRPAAAVTDTGLLKTAYSQTTTGTGAADWVHANAAWGALMLKELTRVG